MYIKNIKIGDLNIKNNVFLAPMAGITDKAFRKICIDMGASLTYSEMISSKGVYYNDKKTLNLIEKNENEKPYAIQLFGNDPYIISEAIKRIEHLGDIIDINMGCPAPKLVKNGDGAGLLLNLENVEEIIKEATKISKKPITVKTRKGFNNDIITAVEVAKICEKYGVAMITIHGRTREEYYSGKSDLDIIKAVKQSVSIPVIGNGDIIDIESAEKMFEYTGCDGIMIARGAQGNPWIFKSILEGKEYIPDNKERLKILLEHIDYALENEESKKQAVLKMRKHIAWYLKGLKNSTYIKDMINREEDIERVKEILTEFLS